MRGIAILSAGLAVLMPVGLAAQDVFVYPNKGQSEQQMMTDKGQCHEWAVNETGVDPAQIASEASKPPASEGGGGLGGAGVGAARGAISGGAGAGAVQGFGIGRLVHAIKARRQMEEQQKTAAQDQQQRQAQLQKYDRAFGACLSGRGYTVQ